MVAALSSRHTAAQPSGTSAPFHEEIAATRVVLLGDHMLPLQGLARLLEIVTQAEVYLTLQPGDVHDLVRRWRPDVVVVNVASAPEVEAKLEPLRWVTSSVPVIVTGPDQADVFLAAMRGGARGFTTRDSTVDQLQGCLSAVIRGEWGLPRALLGDLVGAYVTAANTPTRPATVEVHERGRVVLQLLARGHTTKEIAREIYVSEGTVQGDIRTLVRALGVDNRIQLVAEALRRGLLVQDGAAGVGGH